jgi:hypothetical protein
VTHEHHKRKGNKAMNPKKPAITVDLNALDPLAEIIIRAGVLEETPEAIQHLIARYEPERRYDPIIYGLSTVFRQHTSLTELAQRAAFPNNKLSVSFIGVMTRELAKVKHQPVLYFTPTDLRPDHHTLAVALDGVPQVHLTEPVARALIKAFLIIDNPYRHP